MQVLKDQNKILEAQNVLLVQIVTFITPVSAFFAAFKNFVVFVAWILGAFAAGFAAWQVFVAWVKDHH